MWTGVNLPNMLGMNSGSGDLVYLDPPFHRNANYVVGDGSRYRTDTRFYVQSLMEPERMTTEPPS